MMGVLIQLTKQSKRNTILNQANFMFDISGFLLQPNGWELKTISLYLNK